MIRVTSAIWVGAFIRRCHVEGAIATVMRRGATEAGAIFVVIDWLDGTLDLYGPAPQSLFDEDGPADRLFQRLLERTSSDGVRTRIASELKFDPDAWVVEIEDRAGKPRLDLVEPSTPPSRP